jgi:hypothetical protein
MTVIHNLSRSGEQPVSRLRLKNCWRSLLVQFRSKAIIGRRSKM